MKFRLARYLVAAVAMLAIAAPVSAQFTTGRIEVTVADSTGAILPGVTVELTGAADRTAVTDEGGVARFLNLPPGTYAVTAKLQGFRDYVNKSVAVVAGGSVPLKVTLGVAGVATEVEVTAASPVIDPKRMTTSTNVTNEQLQEIPSARDPWVVLQTVPGVIVDRVNVGGAESGQQSSYQAKGASSGDNTWNIDGIAITDMAALGSSPTYYDFDMFEEMQVTTGGADLTMATGGVGLNFVLKSGSNTPRGSARFYFENEDMQATNIPDDLVATLGGAGKKGNRMKEYMDYGAELGGPIVRDRLWAWGAYGKTDVTVLTLLGTPDQTILDNRSLKLTGQATDNVRLGYTFFRGDKLKYGRDASATRPDETTFNQSGPTSLHKGEVNFVVGSNLFLSARGAHVSGGFSLTPKGGLDTPWYTDDAGVHHGSYYQYATDRPQMNFSGDANVFRGNHEIKFGFGWRRADTDSVYRIPGYNSPNAGIHTTHDGYPTMIADVWVGATTSNRAEYMNAFVGDTISFDRMTLNVGVRWDRQAASMMGGTQAGFSPFSTLLPDVSSPSIEEAIVYNSIAPRIGVTYSLNENRSTIARASYAMFADQLGGTAAGFLSTVSHRGLYVYNVVDANGNNVADPAEVQAVINGAPCANTGPLCYPYGFDITNPGQSAESIHTIGDYNTPKTHEFQVGLDHEIFTNFGVSGTFTYRHFNNFNRRDNGLTGEDYAESFRLTGSHPSLGDYDAPVYIATRVPARPAATEFRARDGYYQRYIGFEAAATKRLSNRWMARFGFSTNKHTEHWDSLAAIGDPTPSPGSPNINGGTVVRASGGSGKSGIYQVLPSYQFVATGLYQAPWGINLAANMVTREGFAKQYFRNNVTTTDPLTRNKTVFLLDEAGEERLPMVTSLDFRLGKQFQIQRVRMNVDLDVFNVLNSATVLGREYNLRLTSADTVREIMNPRIFRIGVRVGF